MCNWKELHLPQYSSGRCTPACRTRWGASLRASSALHLRMGSGAEQCAAALQDLAYECIYPSQAQLVEPETTVLRSSLGSSWAQGSRERDFDFARA